MFQHILVAVDGSPTSRFAARQGLALAEHVRGKATLLFVLEPPSVLPVGPLSGYVLTAPPQTPQDIEKAKAELKDMAAEHPSLAVDARVEVGVPSDTICTLANKLGVDLIVIGARGMNQAAKWLLGSVSDRVVHAAPCPVMVVRQQR